MKTVSIIRDRGQLTIPDSVRKAISWLNPMSAVTISVVKPDEIVIKPHQVHVNQERIWELIKKSRAIKGRATGNTLEFLVNDRNSH